MSRIGLFRDCRIASNVVAAVVIILLLVHPTRDLTPICTLLALAMIVKFGPVVWRRFAGKKQKSIRAGAVITQRPALTGPRQLQ
jgi:hypothetical protein